MSRGINKVILIGNLGADPEVRYTPEGTAVANIRLATSSAWKDKETGALQEKTEWHRVVFFRRLAEIVSQYLKKGSKVFIEGYLQTRKWQDKTGQDRYTTEIVANEMQMLDSKSNGNGGFNNQNMMGPEMPSESMPTDPMAATSTSQETKPAKGTETGLGDDDIPF